MTWRIVWTLSQSLVENFASPRLSPSILTSHIVTPPQLQRALTGSHHHGLLLKALVNYNDWAAIMPSLYFRAIIRSSGSPSIANERTGCLSLQISRGPLFPASCGVAFPLGGLQTLTSYLLASHNSLCVLPGRSCSSGVHNLSFRVVASVGYVQSQLLCEEHCSSYLLIGSFSPYRPGKYSLSLLAINLIWNASYIREILSALYLVLWCSACCHVFMHDFSAMVFSLCLYDFIVIWRVYPRLISLLCSGEAVWS